MHGFKRATGYMPNTHICFHMDFIPEMRPLLLFSINFTRLHVKIND